MTPEQEKSLMDEHKYAGFEGINVQFRQMVAQGATQFNMPYQDVYPIAQSQGALTDRMIFEVRSRMGEERPFYNGFLATIVKNMPVNWQHGDLTLSDLEFRLQTPPRHEHADAYNQKLTEDLITVFNNNQPLFYKIAAIYFPVIEPMLKPEHRQHVMDTINGELGGEIRRQYFYANQGITRIEAFNLLDSTERPRAVYKTYRSRNNDQDTAVGEDNKQGATENAVQTYGKWRLIDYTKERDDRGNRPFQDYSDNYGFDAATALRRFSIQIKDEDFTKVVRALEKGHKVGLVPTDTSTHSILFFYANPAAHTLTIEDSAGKLVAHEQYLTPAARAERAERIAHNDSRSFHVATRPITPGRGQEEDNDDQKKKMDHHRRIVGDGADPKKGPQL